MRAFITSCISALLCAACAPAPEADAPLPPLALPLLGATGEVHLADFCGRVLHIELWGSWCGPCVESMAAADRLRASLPREDFEVIGISLDPQSEAAAAFLDRHRVEFSNAWDEARVVQDLFHVDGVPTAILVDRHGRVRERFNGFNARQDEALRDAVRDLVEEDGAACPGA